MNILTVIQARRGSSRLPDKVSLPLAGQPLLVRMVERVQLAKLAGQIVVATTTDAADDALAEMCEAHNINVFRGAPTDLLDRHYQAALAIGNVDAVVKIPSDCPLIDPAVIDQVLGYYIATARQYDFVSNLHPATYPDGNDVEVMPLGALATAWREAQRPLEREHTTPFFWENAGRFRLANVTWETGLDYSMSHRFTIDYREDYEFIQAVFEELHPANPAFGLDDILTLLKQRPDIYALNASLAGVNWYRNHLDELKTVAADQTKSL
ncbi:cytidylyltransferase domain-containing protein [Hymenobacter sp. PAMC 26628]|uniref:cytidylyltransferase domain-containing protein n=1 Tax=Hymenobacter sp. PAMC 26628 TaxID=1484118 RepID=UPI00077066BF|nr:glycosyltransferase family protein [Hymenobacter sp. PAMC 26628]AMJ64283.1 acylneuraminate cytidylyltransferase [Hymenobacter sp. PAMC 26628]